VTRIEAIIQPFRLEEVKEALARVGIEGMTVLDVFGQGRQHGHAAVYRGREYDAHFVPRTKIEIVVHDSDREAVIAAICAAARTGHLGDGKIFVTPVAETIRIRNGQRNEAAL